MVFNTDPHDKPGKHWISLFINIRNETITYFDSAAKPTPREINVFIDRVIEQGLRMKPAIRFRRSPAITTQHQIGNSECGIYSLFFIINMLEDNIDSYFLNNNIIRDKDMHAFRKIYFNMPI
jgi:Ulp1 family protease